MPLVAEVSAEVVVHLHLRTIVGANAYDRGLSNNRCETAFAQQVGPERQNSVR